MRFKRVLLVPVAYYNSTYKPGDVPDLALGYLGEYLSANGVEYDTLDLNLGYSFDDLVKKIDSFKPDLLGIATKSYRYKDSYALIQKIKSAFPKIPIAVGAAHISTEKEKVLEDCSAIDFGIVREGEDSLLELCRGKPFSEIKGLLYREKGKIIFTGDRPFRRDIESIPWPRYEKFELKKYWYPAMVVLTSRGCPEHCTFCAVSVVSGNWWRFRSPESVLEEIKYWYEKGYRRIEFLDDNFTLNQERVVKICDLIAQNNLKGMVFNIPQGVRCDRVSPALLKRMRSAGFESIAFGVEVGNERMLKLIKKGETMQTIDAAIKAAIDAGFDVHLNMMLGFPDQTFQDVEDTFDFALRHPVRWASFNNYVPYSGTEGYAQAKERDLFLIQPEQYLNEFNTKAERIIIRTPNISPEQRRYIEKKIPRIQDEVRKKYHIHRLLRNYGTAGKLVGTLYKANLIPKSVFNGAIELKNRIKSAV
ncbi:MAG: radical SAM protein [Candidatus Micrarchaeota archaeon]